MGDTLFCPLTFPIISPFEPPELPPSLSDIKISRSPTRNTRHVSAAAKRRNLLPGGDWRPVQPGGAAVGGIAIAVQQRRRVPGRRQGDQPQVAGANICHWRAAALPVHASTTPGEDRFPVFI